MPQVTPVLIDAMDEVIEGRDPKAEWDPDEMRAAMLDTARGANQEDAVEGRDLSQATLSKRWNDVKEVREELAAKREDPETLFRDPVKEATDAFGDFMDSLNDKYGFGVKPSVIKMMKDEIRDTGQVPQPQYVDQFLRQMNSGVKGGTVDYITRRYRSWLTNQNFDQQPASDQGNVGYGGVQVGGQSNQPPGMGSGNQVGQQQTQTGGGGGRQQQPQGQRGQQPHQPRGTSPEVEALADQMEQLTSAVMEMQSSDDDGGDMGEITITQDDGTEITLPADHPRAQQMFEDADDDDDFLEKMVRMQEVGLLPKPDEGGPSEGEKLANAVSDTIQEMQQQNMQVQQNMTQQMQSVLEKLAEDDQEDEDLGPDDVREIIQDTLKEDEVDRLEKKMEDKFGQIASKLDSRRSSSEEGVKDPEVIRDEMEYDYREKQLETMNQNLRELPTSFAAAFQKGLLPALQEIQSMQQGQATRMWEPPQNAQRGEPEYTPQPHGPAGRAAREQAARDHQRSQEGQSPTQESEPEDVEPGSHKVNEQEAEAIREKLNLPDADDTNEAKA
jgi:hypothetical protein